MACQRSVNPNINFCAAGVMHCVAAADTDTCSQLRWLAASVYTVVMFRYEKQLAYEWVSRCFAG